MTDMPVFTIKAKDALAPEAIAAYRDLCVRSGLHAQAAQVELALSEVEDWQFTHSDEVHLPDHEHVPWTLAGHLAELVHDEVGGYGISEYGEAVIHDTLWKIHEPYSGMPYDEQVALARAVAEVFYGEGYDYEHPEPPPLIEVQLP